MTFICKAPWTSIAYQPTHLAPCCLYEHGENDNKQLDITDLFTDIKEDFLKGKVPVGCNKCSHAHSNNMPAYYKSFDLYETDFKTSNIQEINIKANNFCNLACRSCGPHFSSKWEKEFNKNIIITKDNNVLNNINLLDFSKLKKIVFAGGEPSLTDEHVAVLNKLLEEKNTDVSIRIATNIHVLEYKNHDLLALWSSFPNLVLHLSVDAVGDHASYIRSGTDWDLVVENLKKIINHKISCYVNVTVSAMNIWFLEDTVEFLTTQSGISDIRFTLLQEPDILNIRVIPSKYKEQVNKILDRCIEKKMKLQSIKDYLNSGNLDNLWEHFLIYNLMLDATRSEAFFKNIPIKQELLLDWVKLS